MKTKSRKSQKRNQKPVSGMRHLGALMENMNGNIKLIAEQHSSVVSKLDTHTKILNSHTEAIGSLKVDVEGIKDILAEHTNKLDEHTRILDEHTEIIKATQTDVEIIKTDTEFIKGSLKKKIEVEEFSALERRVAVLEKRRQ